MDPIKLKLYPHELKQLFTYLTQKAADLKQLQGKAADTDIVLVEWLAVFSKKAVLAMEKARYSTTNVSLPISVARILWKEWQGQFISGTIQLLLNQIDQQLTNRDLKPL